MAFSGESHNPPPPPPPPHTQVFGLLASCDQSPVPMSVVAQVLEVQPGINTVLESVRKCAFLSSHTQGDIETVSVHQLRREVFKDLFLRDASTGRSLSVFYDCTYQLR